MQTVDLQEAQAKLPELIDSLHPGDEIVIEKNHKPVARLLPASADHAIRQPRPLREFAGKFRSLPPAEQDDLKMHDKEWCEPNT